MLNSVVQTVLRRPGFACRCYKDCGLFGDCCRDADPYPVVQELQKYSTCASIAEGHGDVGYQLINKCPEHTRDAELIRQCEAGKVNTWSDKGWTLTNKKTGIRCCMQFCACFTSFHRIN